MVRQKNKEIIIHDYKAIIQSLYKRIESELSEENVKLIKRYDRTLVNESLADATRSKNLAIILSLTRLLEKNWIHTTKEDMENLVFNVNKKFSGNGQETNTTVDHKKILKRFYRWLRLGTRNFVEVGDPPETKWIKPKYVQDKIVRENLISEEDLEKLLRACGENQRDRAFVHCHIEAGTRPGEILNLRIKHVKFDKYGAVLHVDGKTGPRPVRLIRSTPDLANYLDKHPFKDDPDAPLWIMIGNTTYGKPMTYAAALRNFKKCVKKTGIKKRVWPHLLKHVSCSMDSTLGMSDPYRKYKHHWTPNSRMPQVYEHLSKSIISNIQRETLQKQTGLMLPASRIPEEKIGIFKHCNRCEFENPRDSIYCNRCAFPLKEREQFEKSMQQIKIDTVINKIRDDPEKLEKIISIIG